MTSGESNTQGIRPLIVRRDIYDAALGKVSIEQLIATRRMETPYSRMPNGALMRLKVAVSACRHRIENQLPVIVTD